MRLDSSGRLLIGHTSARTGVAGMGDPLIQHEGLNSDDSAVSFIRNSASAFGGSLILGKTRGSSVGANTLVQNGDDIFTIRFAAGDGTDINSEVATIKAEIDGVASANDVPGRLAFATTADGASSPTERMRIDSSGNVGIGTTSPDQLLHLSAASNPLIRVENTDDSLVGDQLVGGIEFEKIDPSGAGVGVVGSMKCRSGSSNGADAYMAFTTSSSSANNQERMRLDSSGRLLLGQTSDTDGSLCMNGVLAFSAGGNGTASTSNVRPNISRGADGQLLLAAGKDSGSSIRFDVAANASTNAAEVMRVDNNGTLLIGRTSAGNTGNGHSLRGGDSVIFSRNSDAGETVQVSRNSNDGPFIQFRSGDSGNASSIGNISKSGSSIVYNTSSDYRLKENEVAISDGITRIKLLKPYRFNFKSHPSKTIDGFFAHEVTPSVPEAITGSKDEVDSDNNPVYQGIDQSKIVPLLTAALQEAISKIEVLETKVAALEAA